MNRKKSFKYNLIAAAVAAVTLSAQAQSVQDEEVPETETLVVVGQATSGLDSLITAEELESFQATDLADAFRRDPTITAGGSIGMSQKIYMRNMGEDSLIISVDGAEQAGATFHHAGRTAIEPELLKQVEIEAGAGSATAGPGALGGSIRFVTKDPEDLLNAGENVGALVKSAFYSNGDGWKNSATVYASSESGSASTLLSLSRFDYDNTEDGDGNELAGTESDKHFGFAKFVVKPSDDQKITVSHEKLSESGDINYKPEFSGSDPAETDWERTTTIVNYDFEPGSNDLVDLSVHFYLTESDQSRFYTNARNPAWDGVYGGIVETTGLTVKNKSLVGNHEFIYGLNYREDDSIAYQEGSGPYAQESGNVKGLFLQDVISLNDQLTLSAGLRYDDYELNDWTGQKITDDGFSPNISANYEIMPGISVSAGYAEAFRGPEVRDSLLVGEYSNDPDLEGERAKNLEVGMNFDGDDYSVAIGVYRADIENAISHGGNIPWNKTFTNMEDEIETLGYFISIEKSWNDLTLSASMNIADTEVNDEAVSRYVYGSTASTIGDTFVLSADYQANPDLVVGWSAEIVRGVDESIFINDTLYGDTYDLTYNKDGYTVHDVYVRWQPMGDDQLTVTLTVNNLFDEQYISHASIEDLEHNPGWEGIVGTASEGRDIRLSAALRF